MMICARGSVRVNGECGAAYVVEEDRVERGAVRREALQRRVRGGERGVGCPATVSVEDVKRKRGASGLEKKKEKTLKVKRSAKETLIGRKGL